MQKGLVYWRVSHRKASIRGFESLIRARAGEFIEYVTEMIEDGADEEGHQEMVFEVEHWARGFVGSENGVSVGTSRASIPYLVAHAS